MLAGSFNIIKGIHTHLKLFFYVSSYMYLYYIFNKNMKINYYLKNDLTYNLKLVI